MALSFSLDKYLGISLGFKSMSIDRQLISKYWSVSTFPDNRWSGRAAESPIVSVTLVPHLAFVDLTRELEYPMKDVLRNHSARTQWRLPRCIIEETVY